MIAISRLIVGGIIVLSLVAAGLVELIVSL